MNVVTQISPLSVLITHAAFKPLTFSDWERLNPDLVQSSGSTCADCDGDGSRECPCCGQSVDCETCGGTGQVGTPMQIYKEQLTADLAALRKLLAEPPDRRLIALPLQVEETPA